MIHARTAITWLGAATLLGVVGYFLFGARPPQSAVPDPNDTAAWQLPAPGQGRDATIASDWLVQDPWQIAPVVTAAEAPPPPPAVPVGVMRVGRAWKAVFVQAGIEQVAGTGERLAGGGQVRSVGPLQVQWLDADGQSHVRELFADPLIDPSAPTGEVPEQ